MPSGARAFAALAALVAGLLAGPRDALAFEKQWHLGAQASYQLFVRPVLGGVHGIGGSAHLSYGLNDMFNLIVDAGVSVHPNPGYDPAAPRPELVIPHVDVGATYVFDVIQWVPWIGLTAGAWDVIGTSSPACPLASNGAPQALCNEMRLGLGATFGMDYQPTREVSVGLNGRYTLLLFGAEVEHMVTVGLRVEHMWGY